MAYFKYDGKKVFYKIEGNGFPLLLLHGNSVSSKMFVTVKGDFKKKFKTILIDFPGHGKSERLPELPTDFWFYNSEVAYALISHLELESVAVIGTSGGAQIAINLALEHPDAVKCLIADSFEGDTPEATWINGLDEERAADKKKLMAKLVWYYCHGKDWRMVVDQDTDVYKRFLETGKNFFHQDISTLKVPTMFTGSFEDEFIDNIDKRYKKLTDKNPAIKTKLFNTGKHPAMVTNKKEFFPAAVDFIEYIGE